MIPITYTQGDATCPQVEGVKIIAHICNDKNAWGAGFVLAISRKWLIAKSSYHAWHRDDSFSLGAIQLVQVEPDILVANMISQHGIYSKNGPPIRYDAFAQCLQKLAKEAKDLKASIHMPKGIGSGLAGGDPDKIRKIIEEELCSKDISVTMYEFK